MSAVFKRLFFRKLKGSDLKNAPRHYKMFPPVIFGEGRDNNSPGCAGVNEKDVLCIKFNYKTYMVDTLFTPVCNKEEEVPDS